MLSVMIHPLRGLIHLVILCCSIFRVNLRHLLLSHLAESEHLLILFDLINYIKETLIIIFLAVCARLHGSLLMHVCLGGICETD